MWLALEIIHQKTKKIADLILEGGERHSRAKPKCKPCIIWRKLLGGVNDFFLCKCHGTGERQLQRSWQPAASWVRAARALWRPTATL